MTNDTSKTLTDRFRTYDGKYPHIWIECKSIVQAEETKQQILRNQEKLEKIQKWFDWCKSEMTVPMVHAYEEILTRQS